MKPFKFCPACGRQLARADGEGGAHCDHCGRKWYRQSAPTAGCAIVVDGRALIAKRAREPEKGKFDVPGGFLGPCEEVIPGLRREISEELGIEIDVSMDDCLQMVPHHYGDEGDCVLAIGFKARLVSGDPSPADDVADLKWVTKEELEEVDFAWEHDRDLVRKALSHE